MEAEEEKNKKFSEEMKGYTLIGDNKNKERKISKEVEPSSEDEERDNGNRKLIKEMEVLAKKDKISNFLSSDDEPSDDDKKLKKEGNLIGLFKNNNLLLGKSAKKGTYHPRSK